MGGGAAFGFPIALRRTRSTFALSVGNTHRVSKELQLSPKLAGQFGFDPSAFVYDPLLPPPFSATHCVFSPRFAARAGGGAVSARGFAASAVEPGGVFAAAIFPDGEGE